MARRKSHNINHNQQRGNFGGRETPRFARRSLPLRDLKREYEDRRTFHPEGLDRPVQRFSGRSIRPRVVGVTKKKSDPRSTFSLSDEFAQAPSFRLGFVEPKDVLLCVRRTTRKEVLHAKKYAGKKKIFRRRGAGSKGINSNFKC